MQSLVILSVLGCAVAVPFLQDTPEVVAERARFMQLYNAQAAAAAAAPDIHTHAHAHNIHHQPTHTVHHVQPTHHTFHHVAPVTQHVARWTGPVAATVPAGLPGSASVVAETADVVAARAAFLQAFKAQVAATSGHQSTITHAPAAVHTPAHVVHHAQPRHHHVHPANPHQIITKWAGPVAATVGAGVNGQIIPVMNTAEVEAATRDFEAAYNAALARNLPSGGSSVVFAAVPHQVAQPATATWTAPAAGSQAVAAADVGAATAAFAAAYNEAIARTG